MCVCYHWAAAEGSHRYLACVFNMQNIMILTLTVQDFHMRKRRSTNPTPETLKPGHILQFCCKNHSNDHLIITILANEFEP